MAEHCSVSPGPVLDTGVRSGDTTSVAFEVMCSLTAARITTSTTGLDFDTDGYSVEVDGIDRGILLRANLLPAGLPSISTVLIRLDPGSHTITLMGLSPNCTTVGPGSHAVTIQDAQIASIDVAVACTATTGVIGVVVEASGTNVNGRYGALVDGASPFPVPLSGPAYLAHVAAGYHVVSLSAPDNCSVETDPQPVTLTAGGLIRDTALVTFSVHCRQAFGTLRITVPTTGPTPNERYMVLYCDAATYVTMCGDAGRVAPNDTLMARIPAWDRERFLHLRNIPANCRAADPIGFTLAVGDTLDLTFPVTCSP
jgi:hypothetical protein